MTLSAGRAAEQSEQASCAERREILDACCGGRMWWWDKSHPLAVYMDRREAPPASFSEVRLRYGEFTSVNEQEEIGLGFAECWRVLAPGGTLVFKWAGSLERVEPHFPCDPIVGSRGGIRGSRDGHLGTRWFIFYKPLAA